MERAVAVPEQNRNLTPGNKPKDISHGKVSLPVAIEVPNRDGFWLPAQCRGHGRIKSAIPLTQEDRDLLTGVVSHGYIGFAVPIEIAGRHKKGPAPAA